MKLIDEKGRLFGKLNIIDALVLIVVILAVALVGFKVWQNHQEQEQQQLEETEKNKEEHWLIYTVEVAEVDPVVYEVVQRFVDAKQDKIDQMLNSDGLVDGFVFDVTAAPHVTYVSCEDGTVKRVESSGEDDRLDLTFTCAANAKNFEKNRVGGQEIRANIPYILKTTHFEFRDGVVLSVAWLESREELGDILNLDVLQAIREANVSEE